MGQSAGSPDPEREAREGTGNDGAEGATPQAAEPASRTPLTQQIGRVVVLLLVVLFVVFAIDNAQRVDFSWVLGATEVVEDAAGEPVGGVPLIVLLLASFGVGVSAGAIVVWQVGRGRRRREETADDVE